MIREATSRLWTSCLLGKIWGLGRYYICPILRSSKLQQIPFRAGDSTEMVSARHLSVTVNHDPPSLVLVSHPDHSHLDGVHHTALHCDCPPAKTTPASALAERRKCHSKLQTFTHNRAHNSICMLFSMKIYFCNTACQHGGIPHWGIITVQCIVCSLQERGSFYLRIFKTGSHCFPSFNSLHLFIHSTVFALLSIQWCFLDPSIWVKRWPSVPNIKMTVRGTMVRSEVCNSWCFCLES